MVATEQLTVGNLTSFLLYAAYVGISIGGLSSFYTEMNKGIGAATRLWEIVDRVPKIPVAGMCPNILGYCTDNTCFHIKMYHFYLFDNNY